jgi:hypothetical protein
MASAGITPGDEHEGVAGEPGSYSLTLRPLAQVRAIGATPTTTFGFMAWSPNRQLDVGRHMGAVVVGLVTVAVVDRPPGLDRHL